MWGKPFPIVSLLFDFHELILSHSFTKISRHVHGFLQEIGQGIQHIASRVDNLAAFVQRGNDFREMTGEVSAEIHLNSRKLGSNIVPQNLMNL